MLKASLSAVVLAIATVGLGACGLFEDAVSFTVCMDPQHFTLDTSQLGVKIPQGSKVPAVPCSSGNNSCQQAGAKVSCQGQGNFSCGLKCESGNCAISAAFEQGTQVDISGNVRNQTSADALSKVTLSRLEYEVPSNSLNFDTPQIEGFVGPRTAKKTTDGGVVLLTKLPVIPKKSTKGTTRVNSSGAGQAKLAGFVQNYRTPFKVFAKASLSFRSGSEVPKGKLQMSLKACFRADPL